MADATERRSAIKTWVETNEKATKKECLTWIYAEWPDISTGGHRGMLNRMYPNGDSPWDEDGNVIPRRRRNLQGPLQPEKWEGETRVCPRCGREATGPDALTLHFGWRYGGTGIQSHCRDCR